MKWNALWIVTVMALVPAFVGALATVESRTGDPVVFSEESTVHSAAATVRSPGMPSASAEDRAALLGMKQLETLKQEISELRGLVETQDHEIRQLKKSQQDFYTDLDKRVTQLQPCQCGGSAKTATKTAVVLPSAKGKPSITIVPTGKASGISKKEEPIVTAEAIAISEDDEDESEATEITVASPSSADHQLTEKAVYEAAYDLVRTKRYSEATLAFQNYLQEFKKGEHAANAHYWMGEVYMVEWQKDPTDKALLDKAAHAFSNITSQFPTNPKVPDALLKLGIVETEKGNISSARKYFVDVKNRYPGSAAARIAETRLKQLST
jgi:tol-pal system protein YbgF